MKKKCRKLIVLSVLLFLSLSCATEAEQRETLSPVSRFYIINPLDSYRVVDFQAHSFVLAMREPLSKIIKLSDFVWDDNELIYVETSDGFLRQYPWSEIRDFLEQSEYEQVRDGKNQILAGYFYRNDRMDKRTEFSFIDGFSGQVNSISVSAGSYEIHFDEPVLIECSFSIPNNSPGKTDKRVIQPLSLYYFTS